MDYYDEQSNEMIVLESIYEDVMNVISDSPYEFTVDIKYSDMEGKITLNPPSVILRCKFPEKYPEELPDISIESSENLPVSCVERLSQHLLDEAEKNLGTVMVYTLITAAQEWLNDYEDNIQKELAEENEKKAKIQADIERKKFEGTIVTKESFLKWKADFDSERMVTVTQESIDKCKKLTGKELFMKDVTLNESDLKFLEEEDGETIKVDESVFQKLDNLDISEN